MKKIFACLICLGVVGSLFAELAECHHSSLLEESPLAENKGSLPMWDNGDMEMFFYNVNEADILWKNGQLEEALAAYKTIIEPLSEDLISQSVKLRLCCLQCELGQEEEAVKGMAAIYYSLGMQSQDVEKLFFSGEHEDGIQKLLHKTLPKLKTKVFEHTLEQPVSVP